jgi:Gelsolin repeat
VLPAGVAAESSQLNADGAYLLDNGRLFLLWLGHSISRDFVAQVRPC